MSPTQDVSINVPIQNADRLKAIAQERSARSEDDIITDTVAALSNHAEGNMLIAAIVAKGFESESWLDVACVRATLKQRFQLKNSL
jgi:hypothetical protein